jgi:hypothetical protein
VVARDDNHSPLVDNAGVASFLWSWSVAQR